MARSLLLGAVAFTVLGFNSLVDVCGQSILDDLYGQGVHAYFEGDYEASAQWLGQAIAQDTQDPRVYYFRGLSHLALGNDDEAQADFAQGAEIETSGTEQFYPVANSLARVQGSARSKLERARKAAQATARERELARQRARYEATLAAEARVLRGAQEGAADVPEIQVVGDIELPFPGIDADATVETDFALLGGPALSELTVATDPSVDTTGDVKPAVDPSDPFATGRPAGGADTTGTETTGTETTEPVVPPTPAGAGEGSGGGVLGGLLRAFGGTIPDPTKAAQLIPGAENVLPPAGVDPDFDPTEPETKAGEDPFGVKPKDDGN